MSIEGRKIVRVREMTAKEANAEGWGFNMHGAPNVLVLDDGSTVFASSDPEGNAPGSLFGKDKGGKGFYV
jgi:hypothetical protein